MSATLELDPGFFMLATLELVLGFFMSATPELVLVFLTGLSDVLKVTLLMEKTLSLITVVPWWIKSLATSSLTNLTKA